MKWLQAGTKECCIRKLNRTKIEGAWKVHGEVHGEVHERCMRGAWVVHGWCMGGAWVVHEEEDGVCKVT